MADRVHTGLMMREASAKTVGDGVETVIYLMEKIRSAIKAENEACAKAAEGCHKRPAIIDLTSAMVSGKVKEIAEAIRSRVGGFPSE